MLTPPEERSIVKMPRKVVLLVMAKDRPPKLDICTQDMVCVCACDTSYAA